MTLPFKLQRLTQPGIEPVTLGEFKKHLRIDADLTADDDILSSLIVAAREWYEKETGRALIDQKWQQTIEDHQRRYTWPTVRIFHFERLQEIVLRRSPVLQVIDFVTVGTDGSETAVDASSYRLDDLGTKWPRIVPLVGFGGCVELRVRFRAGFADRTGSPTEGAEKVPETAKQAIKLYGEALFDRDKNSMDLLKSTAQYLASVESANLSTV